MKMSDQGQSFSPATAACALENLVNNLPRYVDVAAITYERLASLEPADDIKAVIAHQTACRTALAHVEALLKIGRSIQELAEGSTTERNGITVDHLLDEAQAALSAMATDNTDSD